MNKKLLILFPVFPFVILLVCFKINGLDRNAILLKNRIYFVQQSNTTTAIQFQNKDDLRIWKASSNARIEISRNDWPSFTGSYAKISFSKVSPDKVGTANIIQSAVKKDTENPSSLSSALTTFVEAPIEILKDNGESLSQYDFLKFETYNPTDQPIDYTVNIKDPTGKGRSIPFFISLNPKEKRIIKIDLKSPPLFPRIDLINRYLSSSSKHANHIQLVIPLLPHDVSFYISEIELQKERRVKNEFKLLNPLSESTSEPFFLVPKSTMEQVFLEKQKFETDLQILNSQELFGAKNESEGFQAVIYPGKEKLSNVSWALSDIINSSGDQIPAQINMVGYVDVAIQPRYRIPFLGWYPDPILDSIFSVKEIPASEVLPLFINLNIPKNAKPGKYTGELKVKSDQGEKRLAINLEVWDFEIPTRSHNTFLSQFYSLSSMSQFMPPKEPAKTFKERSQKLTQRFEDWMLSYHIQPGNIYSASPPDWDENRLKELIEKGLNAINLSYIRIDRKEADNYNEKEYWRRVEKQIEAIHDYLPTIKKAGAWDDSEILKYIFLFDEWPGSNAEIVYQTAKRLKEEFPDIKLLTTMSDLTYGIGRKDGDLIDIWIPHVNILQSNKMYMDASRAKNRKFGWYFAIGAYSPYPNFWIENEVIQSRIAMGALSYKYNVPIFIYWATNRWFNNNPRFLEKGPITRWKAESYGTKAKSLANGEGSIFYARMSKKDGLGSRPVSTLRLENIRDGLEDYEYFIILNDLYRKKGIDKKLQINSEVIENVGKYTNDPQLILKERKKIAEKILKLKS